MRTLGRQTFRSCALRHRRPAGCRPRSAVPGAIAPPLRRPMLPLAPRRSAPSRPLAPGARLPRAAPVCAISAWKRAAVSWASRSKRAMRWRCSSMTRCAAWRLAVRSESCRLAWSSASWARARASAASCSLSAASPRCCASLSCAACKLALFAAEPVEHAVGVADRLFLAAEIGHRLDETGFEFLAAGHSARFSSSSRLARSMVRRCSTAARTVSCSRKAGSLSPSSSRWRSACGRGLRVLGEEAGRLVERPGIALGMVGGILPGEIKAGRLELAGFRRTAICILRLAGLALEARQLRLQLPDDILEARRHSAPPP